MSSKDAAPIATTGRFIIRPYLPVAQHQAVAPVQVADERVRFCGRVEDRYAFHRFAVDALKAIGILPRIVLIGQ